MKNILKLTGVSVLAIVATANAYAAGYTCEELIEYTSCNPGYYLNAGECIERTSCPSGSYLNVDCFNDASFGGEAGSIYLSRWDGVISCENSIDSWLPTIECKPCPSVGMTDKDGNAVTVKSEPGSYGIDSCYIDPNAYFTDTKGTYHYKSNCSAATLTIGMDIDEDLCVNVLSGEWDDAEGCAYFAVPLSQAVCEEIVYDSVAGGEWDSDSGLCFGNWEAYELAVY